MLHELQQEGLQLVDNSYFLEIFRLDLKILVFVEMRPKVQIHRYFDFPEVFLRLNLLTIS